jgi:hypothetical protein
MLEMQKIRKGCYQEMADNFCVFYHPMREVFKCCTGVVYLLAQLDFLATAFCLSLEGMTQRTALAPSTTTQNVTQFCQSSAFACAQNKHPQPQKKFGHKQQQKNATQNHNKLQDLRERERERCWVPESYPRCKEVCDVCGSRRFG